MRWVESITDSMDTNFSKLQEIVEDRGAWHAAVHGVKSVRHDSVTEQQCFDLYGQSWNCHGTCGCVIQLVDVLQ